MFAAGRAICAVGHRQSNHDRAFVLGSFAVLLLVALAAVLIPVRSAIDADRHINQIENDVIPGWCSWTASRVK
jgi:hypothetical protein